MIWESDYVGGTETSLLYEQLMKCFSGEEEPEKTLLNDEWD